MTEPTQTHQAEADRPKKPPKSKPEMFDPDGVPMIKRPMQFSRILRLLGADRTAVTMVGAPGDPRRIRITLLEMTGG